MKQIEEIKDTMKIQGFDTAKQGVFLGKSFQATLDGGKNYFTKPITMLFIAKDQSLFNQLREIKMGAEIRFKASIDHKSFENRLESFELLG